MIILGINSVYHESAAALVVDGRIVAAVEEERLNRHKHGKPARVDTPHLLPLGAIDCCLRMAGIQPGDIHRFAFSFDPQRRVQEFSFDATAPAGDWGDSDGEARFRELLARVPAALSAHLGVDVLGRFHWVRHHLCHAASAYYPSGFDDAAILVIDGIAENASITLARGQGLELQGLRDIHYPHSIGFLWEKLSAFLGFSEYDSAKVMGMAAWGDAARQQAAFAEIARLDHEDFVLNGEVLQFRAPVFEPLEAILGPRRRPDEPLTARHYDIAAALQAYTTQVELALLRQLYRLCPVADLCIAGGVGLNCVANDAVQRQGPFQRLFLPPAPHDAGTAIGAALFVEHAVAGGERPAGAQLTPFLGPSYDDAEISIAIEQAGVSAVRVDDPAEQAAACLAEGKLVAWFSGGLEFGPRALGHRSLLADPRSPSVRQLINTKVKHRELFRPFAASVLEEQVGDWFDIAGWSDGLLYMLFAVPVQPHQASLIPAVLHEDRSCRIQAVRQQLSPAYHALIRAFERRTGIPLVLNTSFNDQEPIVCTPTDAITTFLKTGIDVLFLEHYRIERASAAGIQ